MTTDRTAAPARNTAPATPGPGGARPANGQQQAAPDVFSTLLGAVAPKPADDAPRAQPRDRRPDNDLKLADAPKPADDAKPAADAPKADEATGTEDAPKPPRLVTPEVFALLSSPLPTTPAEATPVAAAQPAVPTEMAPPTTPALPTFAAQLQGPVTPPPALAEPAAATPVELLPATPAPSTPATGGIPLPVLAGLTPATAVDQQLAANAPKLQPQTDAPAPDATAPQPAQSPIANQPQPQPQADAGTQQQQPQPNAHAPAEVAKPADTPPPAQASTPAPVVAPAPAAPVIPLNAPTGLQRLVPLYKAPEMTATMIHIAADRGVTHARLNLKPVELGGIEVRLRTTPEGVAAHLVADSPEAAKLLQQAAGDLRRDLEARDVNLLSLDVSTQQDQQNPDQQAAFADEFGDAQSFGLGGARRSGTPADESLTEIPASAETTLVLPNGVLVDVLA